MKKYEAPVAEVIDFDKDYVLAALTALTRTEPELDHSGSGGGS